MLRIIENFNNVEEGINGPWRIKQTPVRNSAHWLIYNSWAYANTREKSYLDSIAKIARYLVSKNARPYGYSFFNLKGYHNKANGLVGQAWVFEALSEATRVLEDETYAKVAEEVFLQHNYSENLGLWSGLEIDGRHMQIHSTLNQQVWFAATAAELLFVNHNNEIRSRIIKFLDLIDQNIHIMENGLQGIHTKNINSFKRSWLNHSYSALLDYRPCGGKNLRYLKSLIRKKKYNRPKFSYYTKSIGYQSFTLYGLGLLKKVFPQHQFWKSKQMQDTLHFIATSNYKEELNNNCFAYGYNPTGFELPFIIDTFNDIYSEVKYKECVWWLQEQIKRCYNPQSGYFDRNTVDAATLNSRVYQATRLPYSLLALPIR